MASYRISGVVDGSRISAVNKALSGIFKDAAFKVEKVIYKQSRADQLAEAQELVDNAKEIIERLRDELAEWKENIPENLQDGAKAQEVEACHDAVEEIYDGLDGLDFTSVEFPGMF